MVNEIIRDIIENNGTFVASHGEAYFKPHMAAQHPKITLVACCDSRVQPIAIEPDPINKVFTIETIGNQMTSAQGSVDYGILHLHTPVLLIMGHTDCGAIKAFMKGYEKENDAVKCELDNLKACLTVPVCESFDEELMKNIKKNVEHQVSTAMIRYKALIDEGRLTVVGAVYDFVNALGKGHGRLVITNVNGVTEARKIKALPQLEGLDLNNCLKA
ncbi:MAG: carbonic anhydrase [Desulfomonilia bacterium]